jgi:spore maturation protein CgeB
VRLFEAGSCATPIVSDLWDGIETLLEPGREIVLSDTADDVLRSLLGMSEPQRLAIAAAARRRVLGEHTAEHRAQQLETYLGEARKKAERPRRATVGAATA